jgi:3',5'-cyclic AMP phosphodiesterase CpdA
MRIVHFSDIHVGRWPREVSAFIDKRILGSLNFLLRRRRKMQPALVVRALSLIDSLAPDWVVCTGDLTCVGATAEFDAVLRVLGPYADRLGGRFIYVPGNHDAYVANRACRAALEATFRRLNGGRWELSDLPRELRMGGVRLVAVNECHPTNLFLSSGEVLPESQQHLRDWFGTPRDEREKRVFIGHFPCRDRSGHPLSRRRCLVGWQLIDEALSQGRLDVSLCGHDHRPFVRQAGPGLEICAGSLTTYGRLNVLDFCPRTGRFTQFWADVPDDGPAACPAAGDLVAATPAG